MLGLIYFHVEIIVINLPCLRYVIENQFTTDSDEYIVTFENCMSFKSISSIISIAGHFRCVQYIHTRKKGWRFNSKSQRKRMKRKLFTIVRQ